MNMMFSRQIVGVENFPEVGKFRVCLECGHSILYDHTVDAVEEYFPLMGQNRELMCFSCERNQQ
jgi:hypothetical protein